MSIGEPDQSEHGTKRPVWWWLAAVLAAVLVIGGGGWWLFHSNTGSGSGSAQNPAPVAPTAPAPTGSFTVSNDGIVAGKGGAGLAPDSTTSIGFPGTCVGAVAAAASYVPVLRSAVKPVLRDGKVVAGPTPSGLQATLNYILTGASADSRQSLTSSAYPSLGASEVMPSQGGYRLVTCVPGASATVALFECTSVIAAPPAASAMSGRTFCGTDTWDLSYTGSPADWRIADQASPGVAGPEGKQLLLGPLTAQKRAQVLGRIQGWKEYANSPK